MSLSQAGAASISARLKTVLGPGATFRVIKLAVATTSSVASRTTLRLRAAPTLKKTSLYLLVPCAEATTILYGPPDFKFDTTKYPSLFEEAFDSAFVGTYTTDTDAPPTEFPLESETNPFTSDVVS